MQLKKEWFVAFMLLPIYWAQAQDTIRITNGSFEDIPKKGGDLGYWAGIKGWEDCAPLHGFQGESPPDIHPNGFWENNLPASEGKTYLGMVTRDNNTYESVSQRLSGTLFPGQCYAITVHLARADKYVSLSRVTEEKTNYTSPVVMRVWGGSTLCQEMELLAESDVVRNNSWQIYRFKLTPKRPILYLTFSAFYKTPTLAPYCGNILVDGATHIVKIKCSEEAPLIVNADKSQKTNVPSSAKKTTPSAPAIPPKKPAVGNVDKKPVVKEDPKPKIMTDLAKSQFKVGETLLIKSLNFSEDSAVINQNSIPVLDEIFIFLKNNKNIVVEIGGHTNNIPSDDYCDRLSTKRAKVVAEYLINKGLSPERIQFKGYGKRKPIADNRTVPGRKKNQRVELKILSIR